MECQQLELENMELKAKLRASQRDVADLQGELMQTPRELMAAKADNAKLHQQLSSQAELQEGHINQAKQKHEQAETATQQLKLKLRMVSNEVAELQASAAASKNEIARLCEDKAQLRKNMEIANAELAHFQALALAEGSQKSEEVGQECAREGASVDVIRDLQDENTRLQRMLSAANKEALTAQEEFLSLEDENQKLKEQLQSPHV